MTSGIIITKVPRTDVDVDNSSYEIKSPYEVNDDFGNAATLYKKETRLCTEYKAENEANIAKATKQLSDHNEIKDLITIADS